MRVQNGDIILSLGKSVLVVKPGNEEEAKQIFRDLHVNVVTSHGFLGGFLGTSEGKSKENLSKKTYGNGLNV